MVEFLADAAVTTEQAAAELADQTWNKPAAWILGFFLGLAVIAVIILLIRAFQKSDLNERLLKAANEDRIKFAEQGHRDSVQQLSDYKVLSTQILDHLRSIEERVSELKDELIKFIYRGGK